MNKGLPNIQSVAFGQLQPLERPCAPARLHATLRGEPSRAIPADIPMPHPDIVLRKEVLEPIGLRIYALAKATRSAP